MRYVYVCLFIFMMLCEHYGTLKLTQFRLLPSFAIHFDSTPSFTIHFDSINNRIMLYTNMSWRCVVFDCGSDVLALKIHH